ncbi:MAG: hypothetical protein D6760_04405 [Deltaproteobacteria bacterium]|nr:MAG: hypothetical protein D6760_04405 [Deltaproteobacteria bacterium]
MTLLIKPLISVFAYILKLFVALGYVITGNFAMLPADGAAPARATVVVENQSRPTMTVTLADGRKFNGTLRPCYLPAAAAAAWATQDCRTNTCSQPLRRHVAAGSSAKRGCSSVAVGFLLAADGEAMQCLFTLREGVPGVRCRTGDGSILTGPVRMASADGGQLSTEQLGNARGDLVARPAESG